MKIQTILANWKTSLMAVLPAFLSVLIAFGAIDLEQQTAIIDGVEVVFQGADSIINEVIGVISAVAAVIGLWSKDGDKSTEDVQSFGK